jgi:uncharacterized protein YbjT (DUF2867 family)
VADQKLILVTGATGYIGSRLVPILLERGYRVRCLVRNPARLDHQPWLSQVEIAQADLMDYEPVEKALVGVNAAYYLVHNMSSGAHYSERDIVSARNFIFAASSSKVEHIIYLGGLADSSGKIGSHMRSRIQTGEVLRTGDVPVTEFRSSIIIGQGSTAFEMIRFLTEQFPVLVGPRWLKNRTQPIAIHNILDYLVATLEIPASRGQIYEIGGKDVISYAETLLIYARQRGLRRYLLTIPLVPLGLMSYFVEKLTPVHASYANPLIESMRSDSVICDNESQQIFPQIKPLGYQKTVLDALEKVSPNELEPIWRSNENLDIIIKHEGFLIDCRKNNLQVSPESVYRALSGLGGKGGWLYMNWLWRLRGWIDHLLGGPGMRGRRDENNLVVDDIVDFYRVEALVPGQLIRLRAEMKAPGKGWMEWRMKPLVGGGAELTQLAFFAPHGMLGFLYWYLLYPVHRQVFIGLRDRIAQQAVAIESTQQS